MAFLFLGENKTQAHYVFHSCFLAAVAQVSIYLFFSFCICQRVRVFHFRASIQIFKYAIICNKHFTCQIVIVCFLFSRAIYTPFCARHAHRFNIYSNKSTGSDAILREISEFVFADSILSVFMPLENYILFSFSLSLSTISSHSASFFVRFHCLTFFILPTRIHFESHGTSSDSSSPSSTLVLIVKLMVN